MFSKLYLLSGLLTHAAMLGLLLRYLENAGISVRDAIVGIFTQGSVLLEEAGIAAEEAGLVQVTYLPAAPDQDYDEDADLEAEQAYNDSQAEATFDSLFSNEDA